MKLAQSPVKQAALDAGIEVLQDSPRGPELAARLTSLAPDVATVVAYGRILPGAVLDIPPKGFVNLHFSLLPLYRGAAPVQRAIMNGDDVTGASVMVLTEGMDEGPVLARIEEPIDADDTSATLGARLSHLGAGVLVEAIQRYVAGSLEPVPQDDSAATYASKIGTDDARIDWTQTMKQIRDLVRALDPEPGAWSTLNGTRVKIFRVSSDDGAVDLAPGEVRAGPHGLSVGTGDGALSLDEVQPATKRRMSGADLAHGARLSSPARMGE
jgi:methionyl-tRNA formyltransferase